MSALGIESVGFGTMATVCARNAALLLLPIQHTASGGVQPVR